MSTANPNGPDTSEYDLGYSTPYRTSADSHVVNNASSRPCVVNLTGFALRQVHNIPVMSIESGILRVLAKAFDFDRLGPALPVSRSNTLDNEDNNMCALRAVPLDGLVVTEYHAVQ